MVRFESPRHFKPKGKTRFFKKFFLIFSKIFGRGAKKNSYPMDPKVEKIEIFFFEKNFSPGSKFANSSEKRKISTRKLFLRPIWKIWKSQKSHFFTFFTKARKSILGGQVFKKNFDPTKNEFCHFFPLIILYKMRPRKRPK